MVSILIALSVLVVAGGAFFFWQQRRAEHRSFARRLADVDAKLASGEYADAARELAAAAEDERDPAARLALRVRLVRALSGAERYGDAVRVCTEEIAAARTNAEKAEAFVSRARCHAEAGSLEEAASDLAAARSLGSSETAHVDLALTAADVALGRRDLEAAERSLAEAFGAAGRGPRAAEVALGHARLQFLRGGFRQCVAEINRVIEDLPGDDLQALALVTLARSLLEQERPDVVGADAALSRATLIVHHQGTAAVIMAAHALAQAHFGNTQEAIGSAGCAASTSKSPRFAADAHCVAGDTYLFLHKIAEARASYQTALTLDPSRPEALWGLGRCAQDFGLFEVAENYYRLCVESAPGHYAADRAEAALER
jgi:tetratricopeptide (TPR) repeat protein